MPQTSDRVVVLDSLRGIAALGVCWFHFVGNSLIGDGTLRASGAYGWLGVDAFFVISGYVIPLALHRENYRLNHYWTFLTKRLIRLYPPYLVSLAVTLLILISYALYKGTHLHVDAYSLLLHLGFLNGLAGLEWINAIYWTLAIEVQFYLVIGLIFPALITEVKSGRWLAYVVLSLPLLSFPGSVFVFRFIFLFLIGIVTFQASVKLLSRSEYVLLLAAFVICCTLALGPLAALVGLATALIINSKVSGFSWTNSLGKISYSFYLLHGSVGSLVLFLSIRFVFGASGLGKTLALLLAVTSSVAVAALAYQLIERKAMKHSSTFRYQSTSASLRWSNRKDAERAEVTLEL